MPNDDYDDLDDDEFDDRGQARQQQQGPSNAEIRIWKSKAKKWDDAEPELTKLQRENVLLKDDELRKLDDIRREALFTVHRGEATPDAYRTTATALGFIAPPPPDVPSEEQRAHEQMAAASAGSYSPPPPPDVNQRIAEAKNEAEVMAILDSLNGQ